MVRVWLEHNFLSVNDIEAFALHAADATTIQRIDLAVALVAVDVSDGIGNRRMGTVAETHGMVLILLDVENGALHDFFPYAVLVVELGCRFRGGGQRVVPSTGVEVGADSASPVVSVFRVPVFLVVIIVGMEQRHTLMGIAVAEYESHLLGFCFGDDGIGNIVHPHCLVIVNVRNHESVGRVVAVPSRPLAVLDEIVLVGVGVVIDDIGIAMLAHGQQRVDGDISIAELDGRNPATYHLLVGGIAHRTEAAAPIVAARHEVKVIHAKFPGVCKITDKDL